MANFINNIPQVLKSLTLTPTKGTALRARTKAKAATTAKAHPKSSTRSVWVITRDMHHFSVSHHLVGHAHLWQEEQFKKSTNLIKTVPTAYGNLTQVTLPKVAVASAQEAGTATLSHYGKLEESPYVKLRDIGTTVYAHLKAYDEVAVYFCDVAEDIVEGFLVGIDLAAYAFKKPEIKLGKLTLYRDDEKLSKEILTQTAAQAQAINIARHLVNMPPNDLNPKSFAEIAKELLAKSSSVKFEIWGAERLKKEKCNLHLAVGQGSRTSPCLVKIHYRPKKNPKAQPVAFVGKGVTFDSGGLDIKPSSGMRLMKKDMGGAAAVLALAKWAVETNYHSPLDFYLALAENSISGESFRPSDVITARNGMSVEIHNTDAEGRLVLADALDVAVTQAQKPQVVINVATLTGAIKVALGAELAGLFSNHDQLAEDLEIAGTKTGDLMWRMPLYSKYTGAFGSSFADMVNAVDGFGGAITAALFLEKFVRGVRWAHLDIYAWSDRPTGSMSLAGGNGQSVQALIEFLKSRDL